MGRQVESGEIVRNSIKQSTQQKGKGRIKKEYSSPSTRAKPKMGHKWPKKLIIL